MSLLKNEGCEVDLPLVKRLSDSLKNKFKISSESQVDRAVQLSNYYYALGMVDASVRLLESFIAEVVYDSSREDLWGAAGQGKILRAHIANEQCDKKLRNDLLSEIAIHDIMEPSIPRYELYLESLEDHNGCFEFAKTETHKYRCEILSQECLTFLYYFEMFAFDGGWPNIETKLRVNELVGQCYRELKLALLSEKPDKLDADSLR